MTHICPRRLTASHPEDEFDEDQTCSYCGSLDPAVLMQRLERGDVRLGPTDKNYKVYVHNEHGQPFRQSYRTDDDRGGDRSKWKWVNRPTEQTKFYWMHLSDEQMTRFIEIFNMNVLKIGEPGYFYTLPYFMGLK